MSTSLKAMVAPPDRLLPWQRPEKGITTIGVIAPCYGSSRTIYGLDTPHYRHRKLATLPLGKLARGGTFFQNSPWILDASLPLVHTFNATPLNRNYVVSHELELPRYLGGPSDDLLRRGMRLLESDRCKRILSLSEFARQFVMRGFERLGFGHLAAKMEVFRGAITTGDLVRNVGTRPDFGTKPLSGVVIGTNLFRKGGMYALQAFERMRARGQNVSLTLIGRFEEECYTFGAEIPNAKEWSERARSHSWVRFLDPIPYQQVLAELLAHDVCIYPSLDESLGWLPIEASMLGIPVIATKVCALPELVADRQGGWLIELPLREDGRWGGLEVTGEAKRDALADAEARIVAGIEECMTTIANDPTLLERWGTEAARRTAALYGMTTASQKLERIYEEALARR